ncbi:MAG: M48 family metalloprotease [Armatimonadota bacterium]|nr:M48 family metalloprotease [bacterium]
MYEQISGNIWRSRLLVVFFIIVVGAIGYGFYLAYNNPIALIAALLFAFVSSIGSYYYSDQIVLASVHARPATKEEFPQFVNVVEGLALGAGLPVPRAYVMDDPAPNAFATGRDPDHAIVCATTGLLGMMNRVELEGVVAHEMSHIRNYDVRFMTLVAVLVGSIAMLAHWFWWTGRFGGYRSRNNQGGQGQVIFFFIGIALAILAPISTALVQAAISRRREYLADASGAMLTRYPEGLASALEKIENDHHVLTTANSATAHLFISNPFKGGRALSSIFNFSTHPPIEDRIQRLREM